MEDSGKGFWLIVKRTGIIIALLAAALELHFLIQDARSTLDAVKLNALNHILPLIDTKYVVRKTESEFLDNELTEAIHILNEEYLSKGKSAKEFYTSDKADKFREVAGHYEKLGAILKLEYLEFDLIFDIVPFPEEFWHGTKQLRLEISRNWAGKDKALPDFQGNFRWLCNEYKSARLKAGNTVASDRLQCKDVI